MASQIPGSPPVIHRSQSPGSDTESVFSASQAPALIGGVVHSANTSVINLATFGGPSVSPVSSSTSLGGFNAISTVLNNPNKRQHPIDTGSSRYPPLPNHKDADLRKPKKEAVQGYIDEVSKEWDRYITNRKLGARGRAKTAKDDREGGGSALLVQVNDAANSSKENPPPLELLPSVFFDESFNLGNPYTFDMVTERYGTVAEGEQPTESRPLTAEGGEHHLDKLSHYSDIVEQNLLHEISIRSSSFFSALGTLQDLSQSSAACLSLINSLRDELADFKRSHVETGLQIVREQDRRRATLMEMQGVTRVQQWCEAKKMSELLVAHGEYEEALLTIDRLRSQLQTRASLDRNDSASEDSVHGITLLDEENNDGKNNVDLSQIPAIQALLPELDDIEVSIASRLETELISLVQTELNNVHDEAFDLTGLRGRWRLYDQAEPLLVGLVKTGGLEKALTTSYRPLAFSAIRDSLRKSLPSVATEPQLAPLFDLLDDDLAASGRSEPKTREAGAKAAQRLREMTRLEFQALLKVACDGLERGIALLESQERGMLEILDIMARAGESSPSETQHITDEQQHRQHLMPSCVPFGLPTVLAAQLHSAIEVAHVLTARLISLRASNHSQLSMDEFLAFFAQLHTFVERTEKIDILSRRVTKTSTSAAEFGGASDPLVISSTGFGGRRLIPLRSALLNQSKEWLRNFHRVRLEQAARCVEEETWAQAEVPPSINELVRMLVESAEQDPEQWHIDLLDGQDTAAQNNTDKEKAKSQEDTAGLAKVLLFPPDTRNGLDSEAKSYYVVPATLKVVGLTKDYTQAIMNMGRVVGTTEIMTREVELLKQFNSRTCQVVLGAGAMRSAGLKNITAKHLALASQSLSVFIHLIPYLRECVRRHLPDERQAVMLVEFDKLKRDFQEHMYEIHAKLLAIMGDRLSVHCKALSNTDWNAPLTKEDEPPPSKPIADLVNETSTLHKVLSKYLQSAVAEFVTTQVLASIVQRVGTEFAKVEVTREGWDSCQRRMKSDVAHLDLKLSALKATEDGGWDSEGLKAVISSKMSLALPPATPSSKMNRIDNVERPEAAAAADASKNASRTPPMTLRPDSPAPQKRGTPAAYRSKMFPFGRRTAATQAQNSPQTQFSSLGGELRPAIPLPRPDGADSSRPSLDVVTLPPPQAAPPDFSCETDLPDSVDDKGATNVFSSQLTADTVSGRLNDQSELSNLELPGVVTSTNATSSTEPKVVSQPCAALQGPVFTEDGPTMGTENARIEATDQPAEARKSVSVSLSVAEHSTADPASAVQVAKQSAPMHDDKGPENDRSALDDPVDQQVQEPTAEPSVDIASCGSEPLESELPAEAHQLSPAISMGQIASSQPSSPSSVSPTATKPARMTLQQRLAEAARKRAAATSHSKSPALVEAPRPPPPTEVAEEVKKARKSIDNAEDPFVESEKEMPAPPIPSKQQRFFTGSSGAGTAQCTTEKPETEPRRKKMSEPQLNAGDNMASGSTEAKSAEGDGANLLSGSAATTTDGTGIGVVQGGDPDSNYGTPNSSATAPAPEAGSPIQHTIARSGSRGDARADSLGEKTVNDGDNDGEDIRLPHENGEDEDTASGTVTPAATEDAAVVQPETEKSSNPTLDCDAAEFAANGAKEGRSGGKKKKKKKSNKK